jgi:ribosomal protein S18 acetylase RimI-like enzyme
MTTTTLEPPAAPAGGRITYRRYRGLEDIPGMAAANARLRTHVGLLEPIDVDAMLHRYTHLVNSDPLRDCVIAERDGATVGYCRVEWHDLVDGDRIHDITLVVDPAAWGNGIGGAFSGWAEERLREVAAERPSGRRAWFAQFVFDGDDEAERTVLARGYTAVRWNAEMLRSTLDAIEEPVLPDGYLLRAPTQDELRAVFRMGVEAFAEHWGSSEAHEHDLAEWVDDPRFRRDLVVVAWAGLEPAACVSNMVETQPDGSLRGLLDSVSTHPRHRRRGLARAAILRSLRLLRDEGATSAYLGVDLDNHNRASELYESCGFRTVSGSAAYRKPFSRQEPAP